MQTCSFSLLILLRLVIFLFADVSYNRPKLCPNASWNANATTVANSTIVGTYGFSVFVNTEDTIYIVNRDIIWLWMQTKASTTLSRSIGVLPGEPYGVFVTSAGDIYIDNGLIFGQVEKWSWNSSAGSPVMHVTHTCYDIFISVNNSLFCSLTNHHQIVVKPLDDPSPSFSVVLGTGCAGVASNMFMYPRGIFVDVDSTLYVADAVNARIQRFLFGQSNAVTVAGSGAPGTFVFAQPTDVALDADGYLFVSDENTHRIIGSGPYGFRCVVGCTGSNGSAANKLLYPQYITFDSNGNMYVADIGNSRLQMFTLQNTSCGEWRLHVCQVSQYAEGAGDTLRKHLCSVVTIERMLLLTFVRSRKRRTYTAIEITSQLTRMHSISIQNIETRLSSACKNATGENCCV